MPSPGGSSPHRRAVAVGPPDHARDVFEPLLRYVPPDAQGPARYTPRLARSWRVMPGGLEIRIELSPA